MVRKKGFVFTMDAVLALIILITTILFASHFISTQLTSSQLVYEQLYYTASDGMEVLSESEVLYTIGDYWVTGNCSTPSDNQNCTSASNLAKNDLERIMPDNTGFKLRYGNNTIYESGTGRPAQEDADVITTSGRVASGYLVGRPPAGFVARAYVVKWEKRSTTQVFPFSPAGSGWSAKEFIDEKNFILPNDSAIVNATLYVSITYGGSKSSPEFKTLMVNGNQKKDDIDWLHVQQEDEYKSTAAFGTVDITDVVTAGENNILMRIGTPHYNSHINPGMRIEIEFETNESFYTEAEQITKRYYYDELTGEPGVWAIKPYFVPEHATNVKARLHLEVDDLTDFPNEYQQYGHYDVEVYVNSNETIYHNENPEESLVIDLDLANYTQNGTNVVASYFNCYGDEVWGTKSKTINSSSYVEVNYSASEMRRIGYGEVDITKVAQFGGNASNPKQTDFFVPPLESTIADSFVHIAQSFSYLVNVSMWGPSVDETIVFTSPSSRAVPTKNYLPPDNLEGNVTNYVKLLDFQENGSTSALNLFLPWSAIEYSFFAELNVGYGEVFDTADEAEDDALDRLEQRIIDYGLNLSEVDIANETTSFGGVPSLWGPAVFTLEVWR